MSNVADINASIAQARAAAAAAASGTVSQAVVPANQNSPAPVAAGRPVSLSEIVASAGLQVKGFLKVTDRGFLVGKDTTTYFDELDVEFTLGSVKPFYGCRYGNPAKYLKSFDRLTESRSKRSWADCVAEAQRLDPRCTGDYPSADIPLTLRTELKAKKGEVLFEAGDALGLTLSITNFSGFAGFIKPYDDLVSMGRLGSDVLLRGKIVAVQRTSNQNTWGIADFQDFEIVDVQQEEAA